MGTWKVLQLALEFYSVAGSATAVKNLICENITDFEVNCCNWEYFNDQTIRAYSFLVTPD